MFLQVWKPPQLPRAHAFSGDLLARGAILWMLCNGDREAVRLEALLAKLIILLADLW